MAFLLGVNAIAEPLVSAGAAVVLAALLNLRDPLHHFSRVTLTTVELRDAMFIAGALVIVLPLLPDQPARWLAGANPHRLWLLVIVVMLLQAGGHIALRLIGPTMGLPLAGFISGFISSTATIAALGTRCRREPLLLRTCTAGALASTIATFVLAIVVVVMVAPAQLELLAPSFGSALVCATLVFAVSMLGPREGVAYPAPKGHAFSIWQALAFAAALTGITSAVGYGQRYFGQQSMPIGAGLAGLVDFHAAVGSLVSLAGTPRQGGADVTLLVLIAVSSNTLGKLSAACAGGGWRYGWRVGTGLLLILAAAWAPYIAPLAFSSVRNSATISRTNIKQVSTFVHSCPNYWSISSGFPAPGRPTHSTSSQSFSAPRDGHDACHF